LAREYYRKGEKMNTKLPLLITLIAGLVVIIVEFIPRPPFSLITSGLEMWFLIISGFAIILGQMSLLKMNFLKIYHKVSNYQYNWITIVSFFVMFLFGIFFGMQRQSGILEMEYF